MKVFGKFLVFAGAVLPLTVSRAQVLVSNFELEKSATDTLNRSILQNNAGPGSLSPNGLTFGLNQGPTILAPAGIASTYSIAVRFSLSSLEEGQWRKVVDFKDRGSDNGQYIFSFHPQFVVESGIIFQNGPGNIAPGETVDMVFTRSSSIYNAYLNGALQYSFADSTGQGVALLASGSSLFHFLRDDFSTTGEASDGTVKIIRFWDDALSAAQVATAFDPVAVPEPASTGLVVSLLVVGPWLLLRRKPSL